MTVVTGFSSAPPSLAQCFTSALCQIRAMKILVLIRLGSSRYHDTSSVRTYSVGTSLNISGSITEQLGNKISRGRVVEEWWWL